MKTNANFSVSKALASIFLTTMLGWSFGVHSEILFEDDFGSGDIAKHNDFFRWGSGAVRDAGAQSDDIVRIIGPNGTDVNAIEFTYGTWQEVRFHLTSSEDEIRTRNGLSNTSYDTVWISYDMSVPSNYKHRSSGGAGGHNNKGFLTLWQGAYDGNAQNFVVLQYWPANNRSNEVDRSILSATIDGSLYVWKDIANISHRTTNPVTRSSTEIARFEGSHGLYAFLPEDYGKWVNYTFGLFAGSSPGAQDGWIEVYKNGALVGKMVNINFQRNHFNGKSGFDRGYLLGYHNSGYDEQTTFHITNFKFGTSREDFIDDTDPAANSPANFRIVR